MHLLRFLIVSDNTELHRLGNAFASISGNTGTGIG